MLREKDFVVVEVHKIPVVNSVQLHQSLYVLHEKVKEGRVWHGWNFIKPFGGGLGPFECKLISLTGNK